MTIRTIKVPTPQHINYDKKISSRRRPSTKPIFTIASKVVAVGDIVIQGPVIFDKVNDCFMSSSISSTQTATEHICGLHIEIQTKIATKLIQIEIYEMGQMFISTAVERK